MKKKIAVVIVFITILVLPMLTWPIASQFNLPTLEENREKAAFPEFGNDVFSQFDAYFADRAPYRDLLIKMYKNIELKLALLYARMLPHNNGSDYFTAINNVIIGQNDWLFYSADNSVEYYKGTNLPSEAELREYVARAEKVNNYFKAQGKEFVIVVAPNKEQIYSEYMPEGIRVINTVKRVDFIYNYFKTHSDVTVIYPKEELIAAKENRETYYQQDTHWNGYGAYIGAGLIFDALQIPLGNANITAIPWEGGDLTILSAMEPSKYTDYYVAYRQDVTINYLVSVEDEFVLESSNKNGKKLLVLGDSFILGEPEKSDEVSRVGMKEILAKEFEYSIINHRDTFTEGGDYTAEFAEAATVIFEAVERYETSIFEDWGILQYFIDLYGL